MRTINIFGEINEKQANEVIEKVLKFEEEDAKIIEENNKIIDKEHHKPLEELTININSGGGNVIDMFAIYDVVKNLKCQVTTRCFGWGCSAGFILFLMGDKRLVGKNTMLMTHSTSYNCSGNMYENKRVHDDFIEKLEKKATDITLEKTNITAQELEEKKLVDWWFDSDMAIMYGIADDTLE